MAKGKQTKPSTTGEPKGPAASTPEPVTKSEAPARIASPYDRPPDSGRGAGFFLLFIAGLMITAVVVALLQGR